MPRVVIEVRDKHHLRERNEWKLKTGRKHVVVEELLFKYDLNHKYILKAFGVPKAEWCIERLEKHFRQFYKRGTLEQFDILCEMMPRHKPKKIYSMLIYEIRRQSRHKMSWLGEMARMHDKATYYKHYYYERSKYIKQLEEIKGLLDMIVNAESHEERMDAITNARNHLEGNKLTLDTLLTDFTSKWD